MGYQFIEEGKMLKKRAIVALTYIHLIYTVIKHVNLTFKE